MSVALMCLSVACAAKRGCFCFLLFAFCFRFVVAFPSHWRLDVRCWMFCGLLGSTGPVGPADPHISHNSHPSHLSAPGPAEAADTDTCSGLIFNIANRGMEWQIDSWQRKNECFVLNGNSSKSWACFRALAWKSRSTSPSITSSSNLTYRNRSEAEQDKRFKQLIPYVLIICNGKILEISKGPRRPGNAIAWIVFRWNRGPHFGRRSRAFFIASWLPGGHAPRNHGGGGR